MDINRYRELRQKIEEKFRADIEALDRVWELEQSLLGQPVESAIGDLSSKATTQDQIIAILARLPERFTWRILREHLVKANPSGQFPGPSVRHAISKVVDAGKIVVVEQGTGRAPSWYRVRTPGENRGH